MYCKWGIVMDSVYCWLGVALASMPVGWQPITGILELGLRNTDCGLQSSLHFTCGVVKPSWSLAIRSSMDSTLTKGWLVLLLQAPAEGPVQSQLQLCPPSMQRAALFLCTSASAHWLSSSARHGERQSRGACGDGVRDGWEINSSIKSRNNWSAAGDVRFTALGRSQKEAHSK